MAYIHLMQVTRSICRSCNRPRWRLEPQRIQGQLHLEHTAVIYSRCTQDMHRDGQIFSAQESPQLANQAKLVKGTPGHIGLGLKVPPTMNLLLQGESNPTQRNDTSNPASNLPFTSTLVKLKSCVTFLLRWQRQSTNLDLIRCYGRKGSREMFWTNYITMAVFGNCACHSN